MRASPGRKTAILVVTSIFIRKVEASKRTRTIVGTRVRAKTMGNTTATATATASTTTIGYLLAKVKIPYLERS